jgi:hypothetical protein
LHSTQLAGLESAKFDTTVDFGSSHINVHDLSIGTNNAITYDLSEASQGTHLNTSLKDLQKLGVDAVSIGANVHDISLDLGSAFSSAQFQAASLPTFNGGTDLHVTLNVADTQQLDALAETGAVLFSHGIDAVELDLSGQGSLDTLLGRGLLGSELTTLESELSAVRSGSGLDTVVGIDQAQAHELLSAGLSFSADSGETALLNASAGAQGTHLSTSLKDLQKLGIDAVTLAAGGAHEISLNLGSLGSLSPTGMPIFGDTNADGVLSTAENDAIKVTLDVADLNQLQEVAAFDNSSLHNAGVDAVHLDLVGNTNFDLASNWTALETALSGVHGHSLDAIVGIDLTQAGDLIAANFAHHFASTDTVMLDASAGGHGTHMGTSLKDLQKLGVDAVSFDHDVHSIQLNLGTDTTALEGSHIPSFSGALDVTLNVHQAQFNEIGELQDSLVKAGIDHLGVFSSDLGNQDSLSALFGTLDSGLDITLKVDQDQTWTDANSFALNGIDLLGGFNLDAQSTWGDLIQTLHESGLGNVAIAQDANVTIGDDLSSALYESGMLHALPQANITIDAGFNTVLNTSLKAMADLGVDHVATEQDKVYVQLGIKPEDLHTVADLSDLFSAFGLDKADHTPLFADNQQAGLVLDQTSFSTLGAAGVQELVGQLSKLGFTELDVVGADKSDHVYNITAQSLQLTEVRPLGESGADADLLALFDPHHMTTKVVK